MHNFIRFYKNKNKKKPGYFYMMSLEGNIGKQTQMVHHSVIHKDP